MRAAQTSLGMATSHIDTHYSPLFPFGFGLSYTQFDYTQPRVCKSIDAATGRWQTEVAVTVANTGLQAGIEIVQLYLRDHVCSQTRPERELIAFDRIQLAPGETGEVNFALSLEAFAFYTPSGERRVEAGMFTLYISASSSGGLALEVALTAEDLQQGREAI